MKRCPHCQRTFTDDSQSFCNSDGHALVEELSGSYGREAGGHGVYSPPASGSNWQPPSYGQMGGAPQGGQRKVWPWVVGCGALIALGVVALVGASVFIYIHGERPEEPQVARKEPEKNTTRFANTKSNLSAKLQTRFSDFSFEYPQEWTRDAKAGKGDSDNFVKVEKLLTEDGAKFPIENFAVGWFTGTGVAASDKLLYPTLAAQLSSQFERTFPNYRKLSEGETRVGRYEGYEFRFEGLQEGTAKGDLKMWGRTVILSNPVAGQRNGVTLIMIASSLSDEVASVNDVGEKGELPGILSSFKLGK